MVSPDDLNQILMALKDAGATRAKLGPDYLEVEFAPSVEDAAAPVSTPTRTPTAAPVVEGRAGYTALFPGKPPGFTPATE